MVGGNGEIGMGGGICPVQRIQLLLTPHLVALPVPLQSPSPSLPAPGSQAHSFCHTPVFSSTVNLILMLTFTLSFTMSLTFSLTVMLILMLTLMLSYISADISKGNCLIISVRLKEWTEMNVSHSVNTCVKYSINKSDCLY